MVLIKVTYDAYNRQFKVLDHDLARMLQDGETYLVIADVSADSKPIIENPTNQECTNDVPMAWKIMAAAAGA